MFTPDNFYINKIRFHLPSIQFIGHNSSSASRTRIPTRTRKTFQRCLNPVYFTETSPQHFPLKALCYITESLVQGNRHSVNMTMNNNKRMHWSARSCDPLPFVNSPPLIGLPTYTLYVWMRYLKIFKAQTIRYRLLHIFFCSSLVCSCFASIHRSSLHPSIWKRSTVETLQNALRTLYCSRSFRIVVTKGRPERGGASYGLFKGGNP